MATAVFVCVMALISAATAQLLAQVTDHPYHAVVHEERRLLSDMLQGLVRKALLQLQQNDQRQHTSAGDALRLEHSAMYRVSGYPTIADDVLKRMITERPSSPHVSKAMIERGLLALQEQQFPQAHASLAIGAQQARTDRLRRGDRAYQPLEHLATFWDGVSLANMGTYREAIEAFQACVRADSVGIYADVALLMIGVVHERNGAIAEAQRAYRDVRTAYGWSVAAVRARIREAQLLLRLGQPERCLDVLTGVEDQLPQHDTTTLRLAEELSVVRITALLGRGMVERASDSCSAFLERYGSSPYRMLVYLQRSFADLSLQRTERAVEGCAIILDSVPDEVSPVRQQAQLYRAIGLVRLGRGAEARQILLDLGARSDYTYRAQALLEVGQLAYSDGRFADAAQALERSIRASEEASTTIRAELLLGATRIEQQRWVDAAGAYARAGNLAERANIAFLPHRDRYLAESRLKRGICLVQAGEARQSINALTTYLGNHPTDAQRDEATFWLAEAMYRENLLSNAEQLYNELVLDQTASTRREEAMYGLAWTQFRRKRLREAVRSFERFVETYPTSVYTTDALVRLGDALYILRDYAAAAKRYQEASARGSRSEAGQYAGYQAGKALYLAGTFESAVAFLRQFVGAHPKSRLADDALFLIGWIAFQQQRDAEAIVEFQRLLQAYPDGDHAERALYTIADAQYNLGNVEESISTYRRLLASYPAHPLAAEAARSMQMALVGMGRTEEAVKVADDLILANPNSRVAEEFAFKKAEIFYTGAQYGTAAAELRAYVSAFPSSQRTDEALFLLAQTYMSMDELDPARSAVSELRKKFPTSGYVPRALMELARYHEDHAQAELADSLYATVMTSFVDDSAQASRAGFQRATLFRMRGDTSRALATYLDVADRYPGSEYGDQSRYQVATAFRRAGKVDQAQVQLGTLVRTTVNPLVAANALYDIGDMFARQRRWEEAADIFTKVREEYAGQEDWYTLALIGLGACYEQLDDRSAAMDVYRIVQQLHPEDDYGKTAGARIERLERLERKR